MGSSLTHIDNKIHEKTLYWHNYSIWALNAHIVALEAGNGGNKGPYQALAQHKSSPHHIMSLSAGNHGPHHLRSVQTGSLCWAKVVSFLQN